MIAYQAESDLFRAVSPPFARAVPAGALLDHQSFQETLTRGDEPIKIMRRAGHENMATTMAYVREAENLLTSVGDPFPPLPNALVSPGESPEGPAYWGQLREPTYKTIASPAGFEPA